MYQSHYIFKRDNTNRRISPCSSCMRIKESQLKDLLQKSLVGTSVPAAQQRSLLLDKQVSESVKWLLVGAHMNPLSQSCPSQATVLFIHHPIEFSSNWTAKMQLPLLLLARWKKVISKWFQRPSSLDLFRGRGVLAHLHLPMSISSRPKTCKYLQVPNKAAREWSYRQGQQEPTSPWLANGCLAWLLAVVWNPWPFALA